MPQTSSGPPEAARQPQPIVELRSITVRFPGVIALDGVDLTLRSGEVHAVMGENGAGKSTLIKALTGVYRIDEGTIRVDGEHRQFGSTRDAQTAGIATVYQEVNLCPNLTVGENVMLGHEPRRKGGIDWAATHATAAVHLAALGLDDIDTKSVLSRHPIAVQQLIAISRAMVLQSSVLILDEPTSSLDRDEVSRLFAVIRELRSNGVAILFVSHFLDQVYEISDRITVLRNGRLVGDYATAELPRGELVTKMIGREIDDLREIARATERDIDRTSEPVLSARGVGRRGAIEPADLDVFDGEVVGLAGLLGSGRSEFARLLCGADGADSGELRVHGRAVRFASPRKAIRHGVVFSSEDRRAEGIVSELSVAENIVLGIRAGRGWFRKIRRAELDAVVSEFMEALGIRPADPNMLVGNLSGGNQQKVLLARWLATAPELLILDEPTRGIDVGAKADIQRKVADLARDGLSVIFISSELEEVLRLAQRIAVMRDRRRVGELEAARTDVQGLIDYIANAVGDDDLAVGGAVA
jgi:monosaccharide-transporting ATPase